MRKTLLKLVVFLAVISPFAGFWVAAQSPVHIVIAHTNDIHGQILPRNGIGGMAEMATIIRSMKPDLILDAGDIFTGTFLSDDFKGAPTIQAMNEIGYTSGTIGNHEFDHGQAVLRMTLRNAKFPILSANLKSPISEVKKYALTTMKGLRFGIIGATTGELATATHPRNLKGVAALDVVKSIKQVLTEIRSNSDFIIVTAHLNDEEERSVANAFPEIRLIVGGHNHAVLGPIWAGQTMIAKTGNSGRNVGRVDLDFQDKKLTHIEGRLIPVTNVQPDPRVTKLIKPFESKVAAQMAQVVGEAAGDLKRSRNSESPLHNLIADAFREKGKTQIGIQNLGGIRADIDKGRITWGNVYEVLPFQNTIVTLKLTGAQLKKMLNVDVLAISGLHAQFDARKPSGARLISATLSDGSSIDDTKLYSITTNDFVVDGGDQFSEFAKAKEIHDTGLLLRDVVADYIKARQVISPTVDGRVIVN